jgi:enoyl-CoA hydratase
MMLSGQPVGIDAALSAGIVDLVVDAEDLKDSALNAARDYAQIPPKTFAKVKHQIRSGTITCIATKSRFKSHTAPFVLW